MMRTKEEIKKAIGEMIQINTVYVQALGIFCIALCFDEEFLRNLFLSLQRKDSNFNQTMQYIAFMWLLNLPENQESWDELQASFHIWQEGDKEPNQIAKIFLPWIGKNKKVLDLGVHNGVNTNYYAENNNVIGVEFKEIINKFKSNYKFECFPCDVSKGLNLFKDQEFDVISAGEIIEHLIKPENLIKEIHRVLKTDGILIASCPYKNLDWREPSHCNFVDEDFVDKLLEGFFIIENKTKDLIIKDGSIIFKAAKIKGKEK